MQHRIVIDLYSHTPASEVRDILEALRGIGIDDARYEADPTRTEIEKIAADLGIDLN